MLLNNIKERSIKMKHFFFRTADFALYFNSIFNYVKSFFCSDFIFFPFSTFSIFIFFFIKSLSYFFFFFFSLFFCLFCCCHLRRFFIFFSLLPFSIFHFHFHFFFHPKHNKQRNKKKNPSIVGGKLN